MRFLPPTLLLAASLTVQAGPPAIYDAAADAKAAPARKDPQTGAQQKDRKAAEADKSRKARAEAKPDEPEEDDR